MTEDAEGAIYVNIASGQSMADEFPKPFGPSISKRREKRNARQIYLDTLDNMESYFAEIMAVVRMQFGSMVENRGSKTISTSSLRTRGSENIPNKRLSTGSTPTGQHKRSGWRSGTTPSRAR